MKQPQQLVERLERLQLFDAQWYLARNEDVRASGKNPLAHYLEFGIQEERLPGPFSGRLPQGPVRVLYALSLQTGGTQQTNEDLMNAMISRSDAPPDCFVLRCIGQDLRLFLYGDGVYAMIARHSLAVEVAPFPHQNAEFDKVVGRWLDALGISLVHIRHSAYQSTGLIDIAYEKQIPVVYSFHDYYTACPSVKLLDENQQFCGARCSSTLGECHQELWYKPRMPPLKHESVYSWQRQFAGALALCSGFVTTIEAAKQIMLDVFPALKDKPFSVIPHGRDFTERFQLAREPVPGEPLRVLVPGSISVSKGAGILRQLASMPELAHVQWHILGTLSEETESALPDNVIIHGAYKRSDFFAHVERIQPHLGAVLSIWPETWCHTLTELWASGLPVAGFNIGAVGERLQQSGAGWLATEISVGAMADVISTVSEAGAWQQAMDNVKKWQQQGQRSCADMAEDYWQFYHRILGGKAYTVHGDMLNVTTDYS